MSHHLHILCFFTIFLSLTSKSLTARLNSYTPLTDQTYQDLLRQQFSHLQQQQDRQQQTQLQQHQQQQHQYIPRHYENRFSYNQLQTTELSQNHRNYENIKYSKQGPNQISQIPFNLAQQQQQEFQQPYYQRQQPWFGRSIVTAQQYPRQYPLSAFHANSPIYESRRNLAAYEGANSLVPHYHSDFSNSHQNPIEQPSSRDLAQLSNTAADYAAHYEHYLRKYPQRIAPKFGVQNYL